MENKDIVFTLYIIFISSFYQNFDRIFFIFFINTYKSFLIHVMNTQHNQVLTASGIPVATSSHISFHLI